MKLILTGDWILVEPVMRKRITLAGIHMPDGMKQNEPHYGRVLEVGPGKLIEGPIIVVNQANRPSKREKDNEAQLSPSPFPGFIEADENPLIFTDGRRLPMSVKPGDMIFYSVLHPYPILYHGKGHFLIHEYEVFAVVDDEGEIRETLTADVSKSNSDADCPEHGKTCAPWYALSDGKKGLYCPTSHKFYPEEEGEASELH